MGAAVGDWGGKQAPGGIGCGVFGGDGGIIGVHRRDSGETGSIGALLGSWRVWQDQGGSQGLRG